MERSDIELPGYSGQMQQRLPTSSGGTGWAAKGTFDLILAATSETNDFSAGATSATWGSTGGSVGIRKTAKFPVDIGLIPGRSKVVTPACSTGAAGMGSPAKAPIEDQLTAAQFKAFLTNAENGIRLEAATSDLPVRKNVRTSTLKTDHPQVQPPP